MWRSGLLLIALFIAALAVERRLATHHQLRFAWGVALVLAAGVTLSVGSVQGLAQAWRDRQAPPADPAAWRDGATVRVEGILRLRDGADAPRTAPFTGRPAAYLEYGAFAPRRTAGDVSLTQRAHWRGLFADAVELETPTARIPLVGMPPVRHWPEQQVTGASWHAAAVRHLLATRWAPASLGDGEDARPGLAAFSGAAADAQGRIEQHVMNVEAAEALGLRDGVPATAESLQRRLEAIRWTFTERVVPPDAQVTVLGTYRASPRRIDIGLSPMTPQHALHVGAAAPLAEQAWRGTLLFALVLIAMTVAGHVVAYGPAGSWLRQPG